MNRKQTTPEQESELSKSGEYAVHRSRVFDVIALLVCMLLAVAIWIGVMNAKDCEQVALRVLAPRDDYTYTLSVDTLELEGKSVDLKSAESIGVRVPGHAAGVYTLTEEDLELPEGVRLTAPVEITLTVRPK